MPAAASVSLVQLGCHLFARLHAISSILKAQLQCDKLRCNLSAWLQLVSSAANCQGSRDFSSSAQLQTVSLAATVPTKCAFVNSAAHFQPSCNLLTQGREDGCTSTDSVNDNAQLYTLPSSRASTNLASGTTMHNCAATPLA